jgi:serine phosphatase RsbU (regulator of sigma subunit)
LTIKNKISILCLIFCIQTLCLFGQNKELRKDDFRDSTGTGLLITYYESGKIYAKILYKENKVNGFYTTYYENGQIEELGYWKNNKNIGDFTRYYENGNLKQKFVFDSEGKRIGNQFYYHSNGLVYKFFEYFKGREDGYSLEFNELGNLIDIKNYKEGKKLLSGIQDSLIFVNIIDFIKEENKRTKLKRELIETKIALKTEEFNRISEIEKRKKEKSIDSLLFVQKAIELKQLKIEQQYILLEQEKNKQKFEKIKKEKEIQILLNQKQKSDIEKEHALVKLKETENLQLENEKLILEKKIEEKEKQRLISESEKQVKNTILLFVSLILLLSVIGALFIYTRLRLIKRQKIKIDQQKQEVESQKHIVEEKNKEILDSINYAKRIQVAILPSMTAMQIALKDGFVLYKPKDVVAGDFYWMETINKKVYFAAADCTGHGVPGAMVSVICSNALSKALLEEKADSTGDLLDKTREIVIKRLAKSGEIVKDGMDISLCVIDFDNMVLQWSGANNSLWIIRKGEFIEYKHDKQSIGVQDNPKPFASHTIELQKNDTLYIFTDGYQDQFGGPKGKKFRASLLKEKLMDMQNLNMDNQKIILDTEFENWRGQIEQVDDVCVIGVRIN